MDSTKDINRHLQLQRAVRRGDWEALESIFNRDKSIEEDGAIMSYCLRLATREGESTSHVLDNLLKMMKGHDEWVVLPNSIGNTVLHIAAMCGHISTAIILVKHMPSLVSVANHGGLFPVQLAAIHAPKHVLQYFVSIGGDETLYAEEVGVRLLCSTIQAQYFDIALDLVTKHPHTAKLGLANGVSALQVIAQKKPDISDGLRSNFWDSAIAFGRGRKTNVDKQNSKNQQAQKLIRCLCDHLEFLSEADSLKIWGPAIIMAAKHGNHDIVEEIMMLFPDAILITELGTDKSIFHLGIENRCDVFHILNKIGGQKALWESCTVGDSCHNNLLHAAGSLAPSHKLSKISGAALQMQSEMQWFKEVEKHMHINSRESLNLLGKSPRMIFTENHKTLKEEGEKWMKDTANSCTIVAALIATVMFAAAITVPGGNDGNSGLPLFSTNLTFIVFAVADVISLFTSVTSVLMFLAILTSRYAEEDFLYALPKRLILGLGMLFLSITFMMVAFGATILLVFGRKNAWVLGPVAVLACLPVGSFFLLQSPLLVDLIASTYGPGIFGGEGKQQSKE